MARDLEDGESRKIKPKSPFPNHFSVVAYREDSETPYVILIDNDTNREVSLTDGEVEDLIDMFQRALKILPMSK